MRVEMFMPRLEPESLGWTVHLDLITALRHAGHDAKLVTTSTTGRPRARHVINLREPKWTAPAARLGAPWLRTPLLLPAAAALRRHLLDAGRPCADVVYTEVLYPHGAAAWLAMLGRTDRPRFVVSPAGEDILSIDAADFGFRRRAVPRELLTQTLRAADAARANAPLVAHEIAILAPDTPTFVFPVNVSNAIVGLSTTPRSALEPRRHAARRALDFRLGIDSKPVVVSLGRLHPVKAPEVLVAALRDLPDVHAVFAGPSMAVSGRGDMAAWLAAHANDLGVGARVHIIGAVAPEAAADLLLAADAVAAPSHGESLNKVCVEAAAVGTPFVVTDTSGIAAYLEDSSIGRIIRPRQPGELAQTLGELLDLPPCSDDEARRCFVDRFSAARVARQLCDDIFEGSTATRSA